MNILKTLENVVGENARKIHIQDTIPKAPSGGEKLQSNRGRFFHENSSPLKNHTTPTNTDKMVYEKYQNEFSFIS